VCHRVRVVGETEEPLPGGWQTEVHRAGDLVFRSPKPQSRTVVALLRHLRDVGFDGAPRPVGDGFASDGREQLEFVEGQSPHPRPWPEDMLGALGDLLRRLHDATSSFRAQDPAVWRPWFARGLGGHDPVIGHGDLGPWNILTRPDGRLTVLDWDNAGPVDATWDLAQLVWLNAHLHDDDVAAIEGLGSAAERARHAALIVDAYRLASRERATFVDRLIELAVRSAREEAVLASVGPDTASPAQDGYPILWAVAWRVRSAAWMLDHRALLHAAIH
jgi:hypothetical protein